MKAVSGPSKLEAAVAYHEAGHAVVGFWERVANRLLTVSIVPDPEAGTLGHVKRGKFPRVREDELGDDLKPRVSSREFNADVDDARLVERRLKPLVVLLYAGELAEKRLTGRHRWVGSVGDRDTAAGYIEYITGSARQAQKYSEYLWVVADDAVALHWPEIHDLAQELLVRKSMSGRDTTAFLRTWLPRNR